MAFNNNYMYGNYPQPQYQFPPNQYTSPTPQGSGIIWVKGYEAAKAYTVVPGCSVFLFDSDSDKFYVKSVDISGMPNPIRTYSYKEETITMENKIHSEQEAAQEQTIGYATKEELQEQIQLMKSEIDKLTELLVEQKG